MPRIRTVVRLLKPVSAAVLLLTAVACGENSTPTSSTPTRARLAVSVAPSPITAQRCSPQCLSESGTAFDFSAPFTVTLKESVGIGAKVNSITVTGSTGFVTFNPVVFDSSHIAQTAGTNHVSPNGSLAVPLSIVYTTPAGTPNLTLNISAQFTDDQSNQVTATGQVTVN
jgi:hypothetical protein